MAQLSLTVTDRLAGLDLCVVGGGLAGLSAALAAAREGARTALVHDRPVLGGNASTEIGVPSSGAGHHNPCANETGIILELLTEERARCCNPPGYRMVNAEWDLVMYDAVLREPNLTLLLNTHACDVVMDGARVQSVLAVQLGNEKAWEISAKLFMDCTGDGTVGVAAGVPWRMGSEARCERGESMAPEEASSSTLGSSLFFRAYDMGRPVPFSPPDWAASYPDEESLSHRDHGFILGGYWWIEIGHPWNTISDNEQIRHELLRHVLGVWDHIRNRCANRERAMNHSLEWVGMVPAKRESRRFVGAHVMTQGEIQARTPYADRIAYGGWIIDDHTPGGILERERRPSFDDAPESTFLVAPYSIPLRSLYSLQVPNLMFAGRLMSATRVVFNSLRVQRTLAVVGQAAGTAAAHSARLRREPPELTAQDIEAIQQSLLRQDCYVPGVHNADPRDVASCARVTASSSTKLASSPATAGLPMEGPLAQMLPLCEWPLGVRIHVRNTGTSEQQVRGTLHRAHDIWDLPALEKTCCGNVAFAVPARWQGQVEAEVLGPAYGSGLYWLRLEPTDGVTWLFEADPRPGSTGARHDGGKWEFSPRTFSDWRPFAADVMPASAAYEPENVVSGVARPETWPNVWVSEPSLPQWLRLELAEATALERIRIAWGLSFNRSYFQMGGLFRAPEITRDYTIEVELADGTTARWAQVRDNYHRLRDHPVPGELRSAVRAIVITIEATNGSSRAEVCEVRAEKCLRQSP